MSTDTDTSTADTSTAENAGAPRNSPSPAPEPAAEQSRGNQAVPAADSGQDTPEAPFGDVSEDQADADADDDGASASDGPGREAARYRRRLRDAEAERDTLKATVESLQRAEVDRLATDAGLRPAALWANGAEVGELLGDDGTVDAARVSAAISAAREQLGIAPPPRRRNYVKGEGRTPGQPSKPSGVDAMVGLVMGRDGSDS